MPPRLFPVSFLLLCGILIPPDQSEAQTLGAEGFSILPLSQAREYTEDVELDAVAALPAPVTYEWRRNGIVIPEAKTGKLLLPFSSSSDSGIYRVRASSGTTHAETDCMVQIGPYRGPRSIPEDALLLSTGRGLYQMPENLSGGAMPLPSPLPFLTAGAQLMDTAVDRWGRLHVLSLVMPSRTLPTLSTYYPAFDRWLHRPLIAGTFTSVRGQMLLSTFARSLFMGRMKYDADSFMAASLQSAAGPVWSVFHAPEWGFPREFLTPFPPIPPGPVKIFGGAAFLYPELFSGFLNFSPVQPELLSSTQHIVGVTKSPFASGYAGGFTAGAYLPRSPEAAGPADIIIGKFNGNLAVGLLPDPFNTATISATLFPNPFFTQGQQYTDATPTPSSHVFIGMAQPAVMPSPPPPGLVRFNSATGVVMPIPLPETAAEPYSAYSAATRRVILTESNPPAQPIRLRDGDLLNVPWSIQAEEDSSPALVWEADRMPPWLTVTLKDGYLLLSGTPLKSDIGTTVVSGTARHPSGSSIAGRFSVIVDPRNTPPVPVRAEERRTMEEDAPVLTLYPDVLFTDAETPGEFLTYSVETLSGATLAAPELGTSMGRKALFLTPFPDQHGTASFRLTATDPITPRDPAGLSASMIVTLEITPVNDRPLAVARTLNTPEDTGVAIALSGTDVDSHNLTFEITGQPQHGILSGNIPNLIYTPAPDFNGPDRFSFLVGDGLLQSVAATVEITVDPIPDDPRPTSTPAAATAPASGDLTIFPPGLFFEPDGENLTYTITGISNPSVVSGVTPSSSSGALVVSFTPYSLGGSSTLTLRATDTTGRFVERPFTIALPSPAVPAVRVSQELKINRQTGLLELQVIVTNLSRRSIGGFEVSFSGMPEGVSLYNASNPQSTPAKSVYGLPVEAGGSVTLHYQFYSTSRQTSWTPAITVIPILPPEAAAAGGGIAVDRIMLLPGGTTLLEFASVPGALYQIELMDRGKPWIAVPHVIRAGGTRVQWLDQGPPSTPALPAGASSRFYRVRAL